MQLFVERAAAAQPSFRVTDDNARAVAEICHRLDGIPLALELAAARVRSMPVERIAERLSDRFRLLTSGDRTALPRQQTLRALIDWSYDLLDERERMLFRRLAVFAGGFTLDAAEKVGADGDVDEADVLDLLARLVEKSLVALDGAGERYRMLETVRQYALERLDGSGEAGATRHRHLEFYLALAERARPELIGPRQREWLARLDHERENMIAAHAWCDHVDDGGVLGLRLVRAVKFYLFNRGLLALGLAATKEALARPGAQARNFERCRALSDVGQFETRVGQHAEALDHLNESLAIAREIGDRSRIAVVLQPLGGTHLALGDMEAAHRMLEEALVLAREIGDKREIAAALSSLAQLHRVERAFATAEASCEAYLALARDLGDQESTTVALLSLAMIAVQRDQVARARALLKEASDLEAETGSRSVGQALLDTAAGVAAASGDWTFAARFFGAGDEEATRSGFKRDRADEAFLTEQMAKARAGLESEAFAASEAAGRARGYEATLADVRNWVAGAD